MPRLLLRGLRAGAVALALGSAALALLAAAGFVLPILDILNHLQLPLFFGTLAGLLLVYLLVRARTWRVGVLAFTAAGFLASAAVIVPELVSSLMPRPPQPTDGRPVLKAMTHNLFGLNYDVERVAANIFAEDPDIVALQEYFPEQRGPLHGMLLARYPYFAICSGGKRANIALYAKLPFTHTEDGACNERATPSQRTSRIVATFAPADGFALTVLTTHLDWPYPVARQQQQMADLTQAVNSVGGPLLVMGDMNSTPWSYALRAMTAATGLDRQTRNLVTYPLAVGGDEGLIRTIPFLPLDQVFTRGGVLVHTLRTGSDDGSDHLPVVFTFSVPPRSERGGSD